MTDRVVEIPKSFRLPIYVRSSRSFRTDSDAGGYIIPPNVGSGKGD
jgi:hypothetical protein